MGQSVTFVQGSLTRRGAITAAALTVIALRSGARPALALAQSTPAANTGAMAENAAIWPKFNLNTASEDQFLGIPGAGEKLAHEFEEYRPYTSIGQYRAEIGKYAGPEDIAALEAYLFVPVDPNEADADTLQQLPGVNADVAEALIAGRPYADAAAFLGALQEQSNAELAAAASTFLAPDAGPIATWLKYDLNASSEEQFLGVPGAGEKMAHEFEEYRPYGSIGQFRAEMGKYVGPDDVAAFERYLYVPVDPNEADADTMLQLPGMTPELVTTLEGERPFADSAAFLSALETHVSPDLAAAIASYVTGA